MRTVLTVTSVVLAVAAAAVSGYVIGHYTDRPHAPTEHPAYFGGQSNPYFDSR